MLNQAVLTEVTTIWLDGATAAERAEATLDFRVGAADEPLPKRGITSLALQIAMAAAEDAGFELDGGVDDVRLHLHFRAEPDELADQIAVVARALHGAPPEAIDHQRRRLHDVIEERGDEPDEYSWVLMRLCGPVGAGRLGYRRLGLRHITPEELLAWTARFCTRGNAVVTLPAPPPDALAEAFAALPPGPQIPAPRTRPVPGLDLPAQTEADTDDVLIAALLDSSEAAEALAHVIAARTAGNAAIGAGTTPVDGRSMLLRLGAPASPDDAGAVRDALLGLLEEIAAEGARASELDAWREHREGDLDRCDAEALEQSAFAALHDVPARTPDDRLASAAALDGAQVAAAATAALQQALVVMPDQAAEPPAAGHGHVDDRPDAPVGGREWHRTTAARHTLICRDEGVVLDRSGEIVAVRFDDLAGAAREDDGSLHLTATTGTWISVDSAEVGDDVIEQLATRVPADVLVPSTVDAQRARVREAARTLRHQSLVRQAVRALPRILRADEEIEALVRARADWALGLLAVTSRRILFVPTGDEPRIDLEEVLRADIAGAHAARRLTGSVLTISTRRGRALQFRVGEAKDLARLIGG